MKKNIYKWHRSCSIIIAIPVLLWASSGLMHPLMTNIRPKLATQGLVPVPIDSNRIKVPLQAALLRNRIAHFSNFRLVHIDTNWFYQVQPARKQMPIYLSALNGNKLTAGDWLYAQYLAREFLEGQVVKPAASGIPALSMAFTGGPGASGQVHDCCGAATECVLNPVRGSKVTNVSLLNGFDEEYKSINRLLPVYRVNFDRPDGIRVYVETTQDRFAFAMDNKRAVFDRIFTLVHTWGWLDLLGKAKFAVEGLLALLVLCTTLMGIMIFFTTRSKKAKGNELLKARRNHRFVSIPIALFTLMFSFSGAFHAFSKFRDDTRDRFFVDPSFAAAGLDFDLSRLQRSVNGPLLNIGLVKMQDQAYWQISTVGTSAIYLRTDSLSISKSEEDYARSLATVFSGQPESAVIAGVLLTRFNSEYNFADKRLPVWKISYKTHNNERYYIETASGSLSKRVDDRSLVEEYSFAFLHKHEFMSWGGKGLKDLSTMFWALAQLLMVTVGLILYFKGRKIRAG